MTLCCGHTVWSKADDIHHHPPIVEDPHSLPLDVAAQGFDSSRINSFMGTDKAAERVLEAKASAEAESGCDPLGMGSKKRGMKVASGIGSPVGSETM